MSYISRSRVRVTCTASGATYDTPIAQGGLLYAFHYVLGTASNIATGASCKLTAVGPGGLGSRQILTFTNTSVESMIFPRFESNTTAGATAGSSGVIMYPLSAGDLLRLQVESGGVSGQGTFDYFLEGQV